MSKVEAAKVRRGIERYINEEFVSKLTGAKQFLLAGGLGAFLPLIKDDVDVDTVYKAYRKQFETQPSVTITKEDMQEFHPIGAMLGGLIGPVTFNINDIDKLYRYIMEG